MWASTTMGRISRKAPVVGWRCGARARARRGHGERLDARERGGAESRLVRSGGMRRRGAWWEAPKSVGSK